MLYYTIRRAILIILCMYAISCLSAYGQIREQTFELEPGWNTIYLQIKPEPDDPATILRELPVKSVWTSNSQIASGEDLQDPDELTSEQPDWLRYYPQDHPESRSTNLFAMQAGRAYLINLGGSAPVSLTIPGRPSVQTQVWTPNAFNLVGAAISPDSPPTFASFYGASTAHAAQAIYCLNANAEWALVADPASVSMRPGEACWVYSAGASQYQGPLRLQLEQADGLNYGQTLVEQTIRMNNLADTPATIRIRNLPGGNVKLAYWDPGDTPPEAGWKPLTETLTLSSGVNSEIRLRLAVQRPVSSSADVYTSILEIVSSTGARLLVPVNAQGRELAGLWVGYAVINAVSETLTQDSTTPKPTASEFQFRLLLHVDRENNVRLLKDVIQMWKDGIDGQPGRFVLITDDTLVNQFTGVALRDGTPVGRRLSSVAFDFAGPFVEMTGTGFGQMLTCTIELPSDFPTNPFKHNYHPDHNNVDAEGNPKDEAYAVAREITLGFSAENPERLPAISWGDTEIGGIYKELITELHRQSVSVQGTFRLHRASLTPVLNQ